MKQGFIRGSKCRAKSPTYQFPELTQHIQEATRSNNQDLITIIHGRPYSSFREIKSNLRRKKPYLGGSFSNRDYGPQSNLKETQDLRKLFAFKNKHIHFHINSNRVIILVK